MFDLNMRTTSSLEALNSVIQRSFPAKTTIYKFTDSLKLHESIKSSDLHSMCEGEIGVEQFERRRKKDRERNAKIRKFTLHLINEEITVSEFLQAISKNDVLPTVGMNVLKSSKKRSNSKTADDQESVDDALSDRPTAEPGKKKNSEQITFRPSDQNKRRRRKRDQVSDLLPVCSMAEPEKKKKRLGISSQKRRNKN